MSITDPTEHLPTPPMWKVWTVSHDPTRNLGWENIHPDSPETKSRKWARPPELMLLTTSCKTRGERRHAFSAFQL